MHLNNAIEVAENVSSDTPTLDIQMAHLTLNEHCAKADGRLVKVEGLELSRHKRLKLRLADVLKQRGAKHLQ